MVCAPQTLLVDLALQKQLLRVYNTSILPLVLAVVTLACYRMNVFGLYRSCDGQGDWLGLTVSVLSLPCDVFSVLQEFCWKKWESQQKRSESLFELKHLPAPCELCVSTLTCENPA